MNIPIYLFLIPLIYLLLILSLIINMEMKLNIYDIEKLVKISYKND
jgi:hypothetical protein